MVSLYIATCIILLIKFFPVHGIDLSGLEDIKPRGPQDPRFMTEVDPAVRKWLACGQPKYKTEQVDPLIIRKLKFCFNKMEYTLLDVVIHGSTSRNSKLTYYDLDLYNKTISSTMVYNLYATVKNIMDQNGKCINPKSPIHVSINKHAISSTEAIKVNAEDRPLCYTFCSRLEYFYMKARKVDIECVNQMVPCCKIEWFKQEVAKVVTMAANDALFSAFLTLSKKVPLTTIFGEADCWVPDVDC